MPNRILREGILTSERVAKLVAHEEVFYRRLMSVVDDYGRFYGMPALILAACYPLALKRVSEEDVQQMTSACVAADLLTLYRLGGKDYIELRDFKQQVRAKASRFPDPCAAGATQLLSTRQASAHLDVSVFGVVSVGVENTLGGKPPDPAVDKPPAKPMTAYQTAEATAKQVIAYLNLKAGTKYQGGKPQVKFIIRRILDDGATTEQMRKVIDAKVIEWGTDAEQRKYLAPDTLFNATKWAKYVGQLEQERPPAAEAHAVQVYGTNESNERATIATFNHKGAMDAEAVAKRALANTKLMKEHYPKGDCTKITIAWDGKEERSFTVDELRP